jgi:hypothetical protein
MANVIPLREALNKPRPAEALREAILELKAAGRNQEEIYESLTGLLLEVRGQGADSVHEEVVLDTMDAVSGWCQPHMRLFPESAA